MLNKESNRLSPQMMKFVYLFSKSSGNWRYSCI